MKEKLTIEIVDNYLRDKGILKDNEKAYDIFIKLDKNKEPIELLIDRVTYPTNEEFEKMWKDYDEKYPEGISSGILKSLDKLTKEKYYLYLGETTYYDNIPENDSKYLFENYDFEYLFNDPIYFSIDEDLQEYLDKTDLKIKENISVEDIDKYLRDKNKHFDLFIVILRSQENTPTIYLKVK